MASSAAFQSITLSSVHSFLTRNETRVESVDKLVSYSNDTGKGPVLLLVHGYPQSAFIWRHVAQLIRGKVSLFVPEVPGYGISSLPRGETHPSTIGASLIEACLKVFPDRDIILGGHDRGARICHRLAVDFSQRQPAANVRVLGCILLDIVPTLVQWKAFADAKASVAYFHWPMLAAPIAADMVEAFGPQKWVYGGLDRLSGSNTSAREKFQADKAWDVYMSQFSQRETLEGSSADYHGGAFVEPDKQVSDQAEGRKIAVPTLVAYSKRGLGSIHGDVGNIWRDWVKEGVDLTAVPCGDDVGHYLPEEASEVIGTEIEKFLKTIGV